MKRREVLNIFEEPWQRQRLVVPRKDAAVYSSHRGEDILEFTEENHSDLENSDTDIQGRSLARMRDWTRREAIRSAREYTSDLMGEEVDVSLDRLIFCAGHQPSLFHPGVWIKNFALGRLAQGGDALGLNLVVDNDTLSETRIRVPRRSDPYPQIERIPFDEPRPQMPWEDAQLLDPETFRRFGPNVVAAMADWNIMPLAGELWPVAVEHANRSSNLRDCLTAARHAMEQQWGVHNLELPLSRLCTQDPFLWFASHILAQLPAFQDIYNNVLDEYRGVNRVRSRNHPVARLESDGEWLEAPFRVWRTGDRRRLPVFARQSGREIRLSDGKQEFATLPLSPRMDACCAVEVLRELPKQGIRFRTRALTTTMFARLCLADVFLHGIGGAKYDEMTDRIIARFYQVRPPKFVTLSATLRLPIGKPHDVTPDDESRLRHLLRDIEYNPDRHLPQHVPPDAAALLEERNRLVAEQHDATGQLLTDQERRRQRRENYERFGRLRDIKQQLSPHTADTRGLVESQLGEVRELLAANEILAARDYSYCLYPRQQIEQFMTQGWAD